MQAAHELTVTYSPKSATDVLATLEAIVGDHAADAIRKLIAHTDENPEGNATE